MICDALALVGRCWSVAVFVRPSAVARPRGSDSQLGVFGNAGQNLSLHVLIAVEAPLAEKDADLQIPWPPSAFAIDEVHSRKRFFDAQDRPAPNRSRIARDRSGQIAFVLRIATSTGVYVQRILQGKRGHCP